MISSVSSAMRGKTGCQKFCVIDSIVAGLTATLSLGLVPSIVQLSIISTDLFGSVPIRSRQAYLAAGSAPTFRYLHGTLVGVWLSRWAVHRMTICTAADIVTDSRLSRVHMTVFDCKVP